MNARNPFGILRSRQYTCFLLSQTALSFGDTFQLVATVILLMKLTNSGLTTGFCVICSSLPSLFFSLKAGSLGDRYSSKKIMIVIDFLRGFCVLMFLLCKNKPEIILVLLAISFLNVVYVPSKNKLLVSIFQKEKLLDGNSILAGLNGVANILGPLIAGVCIHAYGTNLPFICSAATYFLSVLFLLGIRVKTEQVASQKRGGRDVWEGLRYCAGSSFLKSILLVTAVIEFSTISVNISFYSFAFDVLKVSGRTWGLILSILYGMSFFSMLLLLFFKKWFDKKSLRIVYGMLVVVSAVWFVYSRLNSILPVFFLEMVEGLMISTANTILLSRYLMHSDFRFSSRTAGIRDIVVSSARLLGVLYTTVVLLHYPPDRIFMVSSLILSVFSISMFVLKPVTKKRAIRPIE